MAVGVVVVVGVVALGVGLVLVVLVVLVAPFFFLLRFAILGFGFCAPVLPPSRPVPLLS
jgi:hypothetical protein